MTYDYDTEVLFSLVNRKRISRKIWSDLRMMDHQAHYSSYRKSIILTMTLIFIFPSMFLNTTYRIHVVTLLLWIDDPSMNETMTPLSPDPRFGTVNPGRGTQKRPRIMWLWSGYYDSRIDQDDGMPLITTRASICLLEEDVRSFHNQLLVLIYSEESTIGWLPLPDWFRRKVLLVGGLISHTNRL
jgi:hypothetical protein